MNYSVLYAWCLVHLGLWSGYLVASLWEPLYRYRGAFHYKYATYSVIIVVGMMAIVVLAPIAKLLPDGWFIMVLLTTLSFIGGLALEYGLKKRIFRMRNENQLQQTQAIALLAVTSLCLVAASAANIVWFFILPQWGVLTTAIGAFVVIVCMYYPVQYTLKYERLYFQTGGKKLFPAEYQTLAWGLITTWLWVLTTLFLRTIL